MTLLDSPVVGLSSDPPTLELTPDEFEQEIVRTVAHANPSDLGEGPYIYSVAVITRGDGGRPEDPGAVYHYQLYGVAESTVRELLQPLTREGALLDVSLRRSSSHDAEHKQVAIKNRKT